ncbi:efflux RND transporter periplasmic adaptor subunit [Thiococcus pfennigii]|jgi:Cu(I)/Ag(I) efflux system membrane fusion protein|uniref:efflux RND transporter periplasmic adaptor subunit n=1 Tax=Thiococcus pfennigii TaxID=1057 RepID=UPI00190842A3|nr:efflux RND transporter periplasmic adaptor subunit [Thiococcus pfennigii]MBK1702481.1 efflux transporter periplasmic adaptor subunit [Thiococcus pfennigii]MBK1733556.1 efflux transporter periplasmic adaptor subunit [Thiococcus pfennigii]
MLYSLIAWPRVGLARAAALALVCAALAGCDAPPSDGDSASLAGTQAPARETAIEHAAKHLDPTYVCPMHPNIVQDHPGTCPICGMDLVEKRVTPKPAAPKADSHPEVALSGAIVQSLGVRTAKVERGTLRREIRAVGRVAYDETRLAHIHPRAAGWIEGLSLRAEGEPVEKGDKLADFYAPEILSAQVDFLIALERGGPGSARIAPDKARNILRLLGVPETVIRAIEKTRQTRNTIPVVAPAAGIVTQMMAREGMYVTQSTEMFTIASLTEVWVLVDVFENQLAWVAPGMPAEMQVPAYPGRIWRGDVDYLYPDLDPKTRTLRVRLVFPNPRLDLKPNMFADVVIAGAPKQDVLKIPRDALIVTGERESVVKALGDGRFQPVDVVTGMEADGEIEVRSGLTEGDEIVVSGQFLIDSESSLQASFRRMR